MTEFWHTVELFAYGFVAGWFATPAWHLTQRVIAEFKLAKQQWSKPYE